MPGTLRLRRALSSVLLLALAAACGDRAPRIAAAPDQQIAAPVAAKRPSEITQQGRTRVDNYAWLKDDNWQAVLRDPSVLRSDVRSHLEAELAYYDAMTAGEAGLRERLFEEMRGRIKEDDSSVPAKDGPYEYYVRYREGGEYAIYARTPVGGGTEQILFDGDAEAGDGAFFSVASVDQSPDHALIAYGVDRLGSEYYSMRFRRIADGTELDETIANTDGYVVWSSDSKSVFYVERDDNQRPKRVKRHVLGTDPAADAVVYEEADDGMFVSLAESQSGEYVLIDVANEVTSEVHYVPAGDPSAPPTMIAPRIEHELYSVEHHEDEFLIVTNAGGAVDFKIVRAPIDRPGRESWVDWVPHDPGTMLLEFFPYADYHVRLERRDALPRVVIADYKGNEHEIAFDEGAYDLSLSSGYEYATTLTRLIYESPSQPAQTFDYDMRTRERTLRKTREVPSGHNAELYVVERITARADDGAEIPVTILRLAAALVDAAPDTVWRVLVDYPRHSGLYPNVVEATVLEADAAHALVRYVVGVGPFSFGFHVNNYPDAARGRLAWSLDRGRRNGLFRESFGYWQLEPRSEGVLLTYAMAARTTLPRFLTAGAERDGMVEAIRAVRARAEQRR